MENALRRALERNQLLLHYQPQISLRDGRIKGVEALLRWQHPELGMVAPADFIPLAEESGQILKIGEWVLRCAVRQIKAWMDDGLVPMVMAVNLSAVQFRHPHLPELVTQILVEEKLAPQYLELELTESVAMDDAPAAIAVMDRLHARGIRMSIDDFGTGYSSLSYLKRFKVYKLKIDQSFVRDISKDPEGRAIVVAIISLANSLGLQTIAEGVETEQQMAFLREQGCDEVQGYYYSKPLPAESFAAFVRAHSPIHD
ncbi:MAG: EAL domain-containing protein [Thiobacillus sp.]|nr:EAL domain-containing protein [Thiobacillus sp.]